MIYFEKVHIDHATQRKTDCILRAWLFAFLLSSENELKKVVMAGEIRENKTRIYVGNLPPDIRSKDIEDLFYKYGKIVFIDLKNRRHRT